ncbi:MAG: SPOR domain-containing protein [Treponematales bacterium]
MKKTSFAACAALALLLFMNASSVWEGSAASAAGGDLPERGYYVATNSFPRNTVVDITNLENSQAIRAIVSSGLESPGLMALLSRDAADAIGLKSKSVGRVRLSQPADPLAFSRFNERRGMSGDPDYDPKALVKANTPLADEAEPEIAAAPEPAPSEAAPAPAPVPEKIVDIPDDYTPPEALKKPESIASAPVPAPEKPPAPPTAAAPMKPPAPAPAAAPEPAPAVASPEKAESVAKASSPAPAESQRTAKAPEPAPAPAQEKPTLPQTAAAPVKQPPAAAAPAREEAPAKAPSPTESGRVAKVPTPAPEKPSAPQTAATPKKPPATAPAAPEPTPARDETAAKAPAPAESGRAARAPEPAPAAAQGEPEVALVPANERPPEHQEAKTLPPESEVAALPQKPREAPKPEKAASPDPGSMIDPIRKLEPPAPAPTQEDIDPSKIIPPIPSRTAQAAPPAMAPQSAPPELRPAPPAPPKTNFSAPTITELEKGKYYLQLAALTKEEAVEAALAKLGGSLPAAVQTSGSPDKPVYRILVGPVNMGESGALLQRFKGSGYKDAFVRSK